MKKNLIKGIVSASVSLLAFGAAASNLSDQFDLVPYVGADAQVRHMEFKKSFGKEQTKSNYPQGNVYLGLKLNQYVGLEVGYESAKSLKKDSDVLGSDVSFGNEFIPGAPDAVGQFKTKTKVRAFHANVVGFLPISEQYCLQLIGSLGIAKTKVNATLNIPSLDNTPFSEEDVLALRQVFSKKKWVPRIGLGLQHMFNCQLGVRAMATWEGTSKIGGMKPKAVGSEFASGTTARVKNSTILGLGLFYNFK